MAADKIAFDYSAMQRRSGDTIRAEDWNAAMRAIAELVAAVNAAAGPAPIPPPAPLPAVSSPPAPASPAGAGADWLRSSPLDPSPARAGTITVGQGLRAVAVDATYAYVSCQHSLRVFDRARYDQSQAFSDPANALYLSHFAPPAPVGQVPCPDAEDIFLAGGYAYLAAGQDGLAIVNIGDPRQPRVASILPLAGSLRRVCVVGDVAYVVSYEQSLQIVGVADKQRPTLLGQIFMEMPNALVVRDNCAFVACDDCGYCFVDVSNPAAPAYLCRYAPDFANGKEICLYGALAYIGDGENHAIRIVDVAQPAAPRAVNTCAIEPGFMPARMLVRGDALLVANLPAWGQGLAVYDLSQPSAPAQVAAIASSAQGMAADERYAYLATDAGALEVYDLRPPQLVLPSGRVGIGAVAPQARLQVQGGRTSLEQEPWHAAELAEGLTACGDAFSPVQYFKDSLGIVHLRGMLKSSTNALVGTQLLFNLPAGCRPEHDELHLVFASAGGTTSQAEHVGWVYVYHSGDVSVGSADHIMVSLDGITFRAFA